MRCEDRRQKPGPGGSDPLSIITRFAEDIICIIDKRLRVRYITSSASKHFGQSPEEMTGHPLCEFLPAEGYAIRKEKIEEVLETGMSASFETRLNFPEHDLWLSTLLTPIRDDAGKITAVLSVSRDITEQKRREELIVRSKQEWLHAIDTMPYLLAVVDKQYRIVRVNKAMGEKLNVPVHEMTGLTCYEHLNPDRRPPPFCPLMRLMVSGDEHSVEMRLDHFGGRYLATMSSVTGTDSDRIGCVYVARELTDSQKDCTIRKEEEYMRFLLKNADYLISLQDLEGRYLYLIPIPVVAPMLGEMMGKTPFDFFEPTIAASIVQRIKKVSQTGTDLTVSNDVSWNGENTFFIDWLSPIRDTNGGVSVVMTVSRKINGSRNALPHADMFQNSMQDLTKRECEVLQLITTGLTNSQIAERLFISKKTVETHRARIMQKLDVHKTSALVKFAMKQGLI